MSSPKLSKITLSQVRRYEPDDWDKKCLAFGFSFEEMNSFDFILLECPREQSATTFSTRLEYCSVKNSAIETWIRA